jgi:hypothetical protein
MTRKLLAGVGAFALAMSSAAAFANCSSGHTVSVSTPVQTAQISTPAGSQSSQPAQE